MSRTVRLASRRFTVVVLVQVELAVHSLGELGRDALGMLATEVRVHPQRDRRVRVTNVCRCHSAARVVMAVSAAREWTSSLV